MEVIPPYSDLAQHPTAADPLMNKFACSLRYYDIQNPFNVAPVCGIDWTQDVKARLGF